LREKNKRHNNNNHNRREKDDNNKENKMNKMNKMNNTIAKEANITRETDSKIQGGVVAIGGIGHEGAKM
jgi:hypothetical protein